MREAIPNRDDLIRGRWPADHENEHRRATQGDPGWPSRPDVFGQLLTPVESAQYLRFDETAAIMYRINYRKVATIKLTDGRYYHSA